MRGVFRLLFFGQTAIQGSQIIDGTGQTVVDHVTADTPGPVGIGQGAGEVHPGLAAQVQVVGQLDDAHIGNGGHGGADGTPDQTLVVIQMHVLTGVGHGLGGGGLKPLTHGHVVVGAGVADGVLGVSMGQVVGGLAGIESELQHLHAGVAGLVTQVQNLLSQEAQIFRNELDLRQAILQSVDKVHAGALDPMAVLGGGVAVGDGPVSLETTEVVQTNHIIQLACSAQAVQPPLEAVPLSVKAYHILIRAVMFSLSMSTMIRTLM